MDAISQKPCRRFSFRFLIADRGAVLVLSDFAQPRLHVGGSELTTSEQRLRIYVMSDSTPQ